MGHPRAGSDVDLFVEDAPDIRAKLLGLGFRPLSHFAAGRGNLQAVYRRGKCDVQLVRSAEVKAKINNSVRDITPLRLLDRFGSKRIRGVMWRALERWHE